MGSIKGLAHEASKVVDLGNQSGEGWLLTGEMMELIENGVENIVCMQPFGCLPNHVTGKGVMKEIKRQNSNANIVAVDYDPIVQHMEPDHAANIANFAEKYPEANISPVDYDPGASEVNQLNRIKLMLSTAFKNLNKRQEKSNDLDGIEEKSIEKKEKVKQKRLISQVWPKKVGWMNQLPEREEI